MSATIQRIGMRTRGERRPASLPPLPYDGDAVTWHVAVVAERGERQAALALRQLGLAAFYPWYHAKVALRRRGKAPGSKAPGSEAGGGFVGVMRPRFPGYLFLGLAPGGPGLAVALAAPRVIDLIRRAGGNGAPVPYVLPAQEIALWRGRCDDDGQLLPNHRPALRDGRRFDRYDRVRVVAGPLRHDERARGKVIEYRAGLCGVELDGFLGRPVTAWFHDEDLVADA